MSTNPVPTIRIIAYTAINDCQRLSDSNKQISRYLRSFRYEHHDPLEIRRMAFNRLLDEKQSRMFGKDDNPDERFNGLSLFMEYLAPCDNGKNDTRELKKLHLLTGEPMSSQEQLERWNKELGLLRLAYPKIKFPVMPVSDESDSVFEILETAYWTQMYYFYKG